jgi:hypothetical protein
MNLKLALASFSLRLDAFEARLWSRLTTADLESRASAIRRALKSGSGPKPA